MKRSKKTKILLLALAAVVLISVSIPAITAYMFRKSESVQIQFQPAQVSCEVIKGNDGSGKLNSVTVKNTSDVPVYIRVRVVTYWQDSKGNTVGRNAPEIGTDAMIKFNQGWSFNTDDWTYDSSNNTYYYKYSVAAKQTTGVEQTTTSLLKGGNGNAFDITSVTETNDSGTPYTYYPVIEFVAEAIQSEPGDAVGVWTKRTQNSNG